MQLKAAKTIPAFRACFASAMVHSRTLCRTCKPNQFSMSTWTGRSGYVRQVVGHHIRRVMQTCFNAGLCNMGTKMGPAFW